MSTAGLFYFQVVWTFFIWLSRQVDFELHTRVESRAELLRLVVSFRGAFQFCVSNNRWQQQFLYLGYMSMGSIIIFTIFHFISLCSQIIKNKDVFT